MNAASADMGPCGGGGPGCGDSAWGGPGVAGGVPGGGGGVACGPPGGGGGTGACLGACPGACSACCPHRNTDSAVRRQRSQACMACGESLSKTKWFKRFWSRKRFAVSPASRCIFVSARRVNTLRGSLFFRRSTTDAQKRSWMPLKTNQPCCRFLPPSQLTESSPSCASCGGAFGCGIEITASMDDTHRVADSVDGARSAYNFPLWPSLTSKFPSPVVPHIALGESEIKPCGFSESTLKYCSCFASASRTK